MVHSLARADTFSLGCVFYFAAHARVPFHEYSSSDDVMRAVRADPGIRPEITADVPPLYA